MRSSRDPNELGNKFAILECITQMKDDPNSRWDSKVVNGVKDTPRMMTRPTTENEAAKYAKYLKAVGIPCEVTPVAGGKYVTAVSLDEVRLINISGVDRESNS
tara:strand:+ start:294 stop:602 length:309 start_codon:yes stop_codon:yes gene_type:complete